MNRQLKVVAMILFFIVGLLFSSCYSPQRFENTESGSDLNNSTKTNQETESVLRKSDGNRYSIKRVSKFSDGYAWIQFHDEDIKGVSEYETYSTACINKSGEVQFVLNIKEFPSYYQDSLWQMGQFYDWHNNTSCVLGRHSSRKDRIYNSKGNILFESTDQLFSVLNYGDGYYAIGKHVQAIDKSEFSLCFMGTDGNYLDKEWKLNNVKDEYFNVVYMGEGIFRVGNDFYNIRNGKTFSSDSYIETVGQFQNSKVICLSSGYSLFFDDGHISTNPINDDNSIAHSTDTKGFCGRYAAFANNENETSWLSIYDSQEDKKIEKLVEYNNGITISGVGGINDDKIVVKLKGVDKKCYFTTYNTAGKQLYEPIRYDDEKYYIGDSCNRIVVKKDGFVHVYDYDGKLIYKLNHNVKTDNSMSGTVIEGYSDDVIYFDNQYYDNKGEKLFGIISDEKGIHELKD